MPEPATDDSPRGGDAPSAKIHELPVAKTAPANANLSTAAAPPAPRKRSWRRGLLLLGPLVVLAGAGALYLAGGRSVSTDNAYVKADKLNIAPEVSGAVAAIAVREGEQVARGQTIFRIDDEPYRIALSGAEAQLGAVRNEITTLQASWRQTIAQIEQARIDVGYYETVYQRQQDLNKRGVATQTTFDQAKRDLDAARERVVVAERSADVILAQLGGDANADIARNPRVRAAQAQVDKAARDLGKTTIVAPMNGVVANVSALQVGQYLSAAQQAMSLVGSDDVWIDANPKETELAAVKPGSAARVTVDAYPGRVWTATVASISPATGAEFSVLPAQNSSGNWVKVVQRVTVRLKVERPADAPQLRSGMSANVEIDTGEVRTLAGTWTALRHAIGL